MLASWVLKYTQIDHESVSCYIGKMGHPSHIIEKKRWLEKHGYISWTGFKDGNALGGKWSSNGRGANTFAVSISVVGSEAIINTLYDIAKRHLSNICGCGGTDDQ